MIHPEVYEVQTKSGSLWLIDIVSGFFMRQPGPGAATYGRDGFLVVVGDFLQVEQGLPLKMRPYPGGWASTFAPLESTPVVSLELLPGEDPMTWPMYPGDREKFFGEDSEPA